jgi:hypothetical protein
LKAALALFEEALALSKALGHGSQICEAQLASIAFLTGETAEAINRARRTAVAARQHGNLAGEFLAQNFLSTFLLLDDQSEPGRAEAIRTFELSRTLGNTGLPGAMYQLALVLTVRGEADAAARLAGFTDGYADRHQLRYGFATTVRSRLVERLRSAMSSEACEAAMAAGAAWSEQEAIAAAEAV